MPSLKSQIKAFATQKLGIDLIGITTAEPHQEGRKHLDEFIEHGLHGDMSYLENSELRTTPQLLLENARSVIVIGINYYRQTPPTPKGRGKIARYAYGRDYHKVIKKTLRQLIAHIEEIAPDSQNRACVDSAPLFEKGYAQQAGLGFAGKNTTLINPQKGSFILLGEILTTLKLTPDTPLTGTCGTCTRCIDACPTNALQKPFQMDARRCISYLTIEHKGDIPSEYDLQGWLFGCDICQEVCPYNQAHAKPLQFEPLKKTKIAGHSQKLTDILALKTDEEFTEKFAGSPLMRAKRKKLQSTAKQLS